MNKSDFIQLTNLVKKWTADCEARKPMKIEVTPGESIQSIMNKVDKTAEFHGGTLMKADCAKELLELLNKMYDDGVEAY